MIAWWSVGALAAPVVLDRVDLLSEAPGTWLVTEAPRLELAPGLVGLRFVEQIAPVFAWGEGTRFEVGGSLASQTVGLSVPLDDRRPATLEAALVTRAALPIGWRTGVAWRAGRVRVGASLVALSGATWLEPSWRDLEVFPAVGLGFGRWRAPGAPWMHRGIGGRDSTVTPDAPPDSDPEK